MLYRKTLHVQEPIRAVKRRSHETLTSEAHPSIETRRSQEMLTIHKPTPKRRSVNRSHEMLTYISPSKQRRVLARAGPCLDHSLFLQASRCAVVVVGAFCRGVPSAEIDCVRLDVERRVFIFDYLVPSPRAARDGPRRRIGFVRL